MNRLCIGFLMILLTFLISGCGGGETTGNGNTVFISSSIKTGTTGAVFANFSGAVFSNISGTRLNPVQSANLMNFTVKSTPYSTIGTIKNSDVNISSISYTFTPKGNAPTFIPTSPTLAYAGLLTPNGTLDIQNVPILWDNDIQQILIGLGATSGLFQYDVGVTFTGIEVNTGAVLKNTITISAFIQKK
jgi:hypothetical protein